MADELKDQRVPIMMSPSEVRGIDDWMFSNRIKSRSEAIRALIRRGIDCQYWKAQALAYEKLSIALSENGDIASALKEVHETKEALVKRFDQQSEDALRELEAMRAWAIERLSASEMPEEQRGELQKHLSDIEAIIERDKDK